MVGQMSASLPGNHQPPELPTLAAPRLIELCFQTAGLWQLTAQGQMGLPLYVQRVRLWRTLEPIEGQFYAVVTPHPAQESFDAVVVDAAGNCCIELTGYKTVAMPNNVDAGPLKKLQSVVEQQVVLV